MEAARSVLAGRTVTEDNRPAATGIVGATVAEASDVEERSDCFTEFRSKK
jgi:hypothetical protein